jgi:hypothetical protein
MPAQSEAQYVVVDASDSGSNTLVAAVASKQIRVLAFALMGGGTVTAAFGSDDGAPTPTVTPITGGFALVANTQVVAGFNPVGWFETVAGEALDLDLSGAVAVGGCLVYTLV